ncbi:DUF2306 domain-containing protein [Streptomyces sp. NPDC059788]|uniref:DUF2306 domain-containing protein n=1 Tax=Streptomyces sp. NPDC059788 TaxID=3346948 RepID=UPI0036648A32
MTTDTRPVRPGPASARGRAARRRAATWWLAVLAATTLVVLCVALRAYVPPDMATSRIPPRSTPHYVLLVCHIFTAAVAVVTGLAQFWPRLRARHPAAHRWAGRAYFFAGVFPSAVLAVPVVGFAPTGFSNQLSLAVLDVLWVVTGIAGYRAARQRRYADHRRWMIRNFALTLVAVASRLCQPVFEHAVAAQLHDPVAYAGDRLAAAHDIATASAWFPLVLNLVVAEAWLRRRPRKTVGAAAAAARTVC